MDPGLTDLYWSTLVGIGLEPSTILNRMEHTPELFIFVWHFLSSQLVESEAQVELFNDMDALDLLTLLAAH